MQQVVFGLIIAVLLFMVFKQQQRHSNERFPVPNLGAPYMIPDLTTNTVLPMTTAATLKGATSETGLGSSARLFSQALFQGSTTELKPGEEVEFLVQKPAATGAVRIWKYKSIKKDERKVLKFTAYVQKGADGKPDDRLVVYAEPQFGNIADLEAYLNEDPKLQHDDGLAFSPSFDRQVNFTVALI